MYHIIIAGGCGKRFWPASRKDKPKQLLKIINNVSLIKLTYDRLLNISDRAKIFIVSSKTFIKEFKKQIKDFPQENFIVEPSPKNTTAAIYLASNFISKINNDAIIGVYPSDHYISSQSKFKTIIKSINDFIENNNKEIVTIGLKIKSPSNSYGYIKIDNNYIKNFYRISKFIEKPTIANAKTFMGDSKYLWNSGMYFAKVSTIIREIIKYKPEMNINLFKKDIVNKKNWANLPDESIDYAVIEKTNNLFCIKANFSLHDLGTWKSLYDLSSKNNNQSVVKGKVLEYGSKNNLIFSKNKLTAVIGMENIAVINFDDVTLIIDMSRSDDVKYIVDKIDEKFK